MTDTARANEKLELEIFPLIQSFERDYSIFFKSITTKKDKEGVLVEIKVNFNEELDVLSVLTQGKKSGNISVGAMDKIRIAAATIDTGRCMEMSLGEIIGAEIYNLIEAFEPEMEGCFKSIKGKKDKSKRLIGITVVLDED